MTSWKSFAISGQRFVRSAWRRGLRPRSGAATFFAIACVAIAAAVRFALNLFSSDVVPFATFYPATLIVTLIGGVWVGILAAVLGGAVGLLFLKSRVIPLDLTGVDAVSVLLYLAASAVIVWGAEQYRRLVRQLEQQESYRQILVDELGHRLQNKLATIHAILRYELRDHRDIRDRISGRLQALEFFGSDKR
jgi:K+-sensing histidine kinase KdpD